MNEQGLAVLSLMSGIDERYITEAGDEKLSLRRKVFKAPIMAAAVIVLLAATTVGTVAAVKGIIGHKENVEHQYEYNPELVSELEKRAEEPLVFENEHLRITIDSVIADAVYVEAAATIEGKDREGKEFVERGLILKEELEGKSQSEIQAIFNSHGIDNSYIPYMAAAGTDGKLTGPSSSADLMYGKKGSSSEAAFVIGLARSRFPAAESIELVCYELKYGTGENRQQGIFEGITVTLPMKANFDTLILSDGEGGEAYLSEVNFYQSAEDIWGGDEFDLTVFFTDGSSEQFDFQPATGETLFEPGKVDHIVFNGRRYDPKEIIPAETEK